MEQTISERSLLDGAAAVSAITPTMFLITLAMSFLAACVAILFLSRTMLTTRAAKSATNGFLADGAVFVFSGRSLMFASEDATRLLGNSREDESSLSGLAGYFKLHNADLIRPLMRLINEGVAFSGEFETEAGEYFEATGQPRGNLATVFVRKVRADRQEQKVVERELEAAKRQLASYQDILSLAPIMSWKRDKDGRVIWGNDLLANMRSAGAETTTGKLPERLPSQFALNEDDRDNLYTERRVSILEDDGANQQENWYTVREHAPKGQEIIGFASSANELVKIETTLSRFIATLTETFAHLPTGLAIFDSSRRMTIFNPALADMTDIDPEWLANAPSFRDFMERLRENQMMPEHKNSSDWKSHIRSIDTEAASGELSEKWVLPSGQTFNVTGRPHPHSAIALVFEDISSHITLERRYRAGIEQSRATLEFLSEAVSVFDTTGALIYANTAFTELWGFDPTKDHDIDNVVAITARWSEACKPTPVWGDLREFATSVDKRASWSAKIEHQDGRVFQAAFAPLPDGSTLAAFTNTGVTAEKDENLRDQLARLIEAHASDMSIMELAVEHMREAIETLTGDAPRTAKALPPDQTPKTAERLTDTVHYTERLMRFRKDLETFDTQTTRSLTDDLTNLLHGDDTPLTLSIDGMSESDGLTTDEKRLLINIMLTTRDLVATSSDIDLSLVRLPDGISASCMFKIDGSKLATPKSLSGLPSRILTRFVEEKSGHVEFDWLDDSGAFKIACTIPEAVALDPSQAQIGA